MKVVVIQNFTTLGIYLLVGMNFHLQSLGIWILSLFIISNQFRIFLWQVIWQLKLFISGWGKQASVSGYWNLNSHSLNVYILKNYFFFKGSNNLGNQAKIFSEDKNYGGKIQSEKSFDMEYLNELECYNLSSHNSRTTVRIELNLFVLWKMQNPTKLTDPSWAPSMRPSSQTSPSVSKPER